MMASAFKRMQMAVQDKLRNHVKQVTEKLDAAGISVKEGGWPANANVGQRGILTTSHSIQSPAQWWRQAR